MLISPPQTRPRTRVRAARATGARRTPGWSLAVGVVLLLAVAATIALVRAESHGLALFAAVLVNIAVLPLAHGRRLSSAAPHSQA